MKTKNIVVGSVLLACNFYAVANDKAINVSEVAQYYDEKVIQSNIINECTQLGAQFSTSTKKYLEKNGWSVKLEPELDESNKEQTLQLEIVNASSSGNAFIGHRKSVSIEAKLYQDGKLVDSYRGMRNSSGGFAGGFKSSCSVLARCVNTLGNDVAKWLKKVSDES
ncbi:hypothetical protein ACM9HF_16030 [Colwellia sp. RE-S-Sl-9]